MFNYLSTFEVSPVLAIMFRLLTHDGMVGETINTYMVYSVDMSSGVPVMTDLFESLETVEAVHEYLKGFHDDVNDQDEYASWVYEFSAEGRDQRHELERADAISRVI